jgi:tetratricopeptide (TPR) repeat protein
VWIEALCEYRCQAFFELSRSNRRSGPARQFDGRLESTRIENDCISSSNWSAIYFPIRPIKSARARFFRIILLSLLIGVACLGLPECKCTAQPAINVPPLDRAEANANLSKLDDSGLIETKSLIDRGAYDGAARKLRDYLSAHSRSSDAHFLLGYVLYRQTKARDSLAEYTLGAQLRTPEAKDLAIVAMDYLLLHDYADADKWLSMASSWQPENALYWYYLGRTKYNENRFQEAIAAFGKCLWLRPKSVRAEYNLGLSYAGMGRDLEAEASYKLAIEWEKNSGQRDPQPFLDIGMLQLQKGHPGQALPYLEEGVEMDARNPRLHEELGRAYEQLSEFARADAELSKAIRLAPLVASLHFELARTYQKEGQTAKARDEFARCAALNATHSSDIAETPNPDPDESGLSILEPKAP